MKQRGNNKTAGFSLIEVIVGIAIMGLVTVPICTSLVLSVRMNAKSRDLMNAQLEAASMVETLMAEGINVSSYGTELTAEELGEITLAGEEKAYSYNGVKLLLEKDTTHDFYAVTVIGEENGQTVELETSIRAADKESVPAEEGGAT